MSRALLAVCAALGGCGPAIKDLVADRHYREAVCAAHDGDTRDRELVGAALERDAAVVVHVHVASASELRTVLGDDTDRVMARGRFVQVVAQSDVLPVDVVRLTTAFGNSDGQVSGLPATWPTLAWMTGEALPPRRTAQTWITGRNVLAAGAALFTAGLSLFFEGFRPETIEVDAPLSEFQRVAPHAAALRGVAEGASCGEHRLSPADGAGQRCSWYFVLDASSPSPVTLNVTARFEARRVGSAASNEGACAVERVWEVPLGVPAAVEEVARERFGDALHAITSVGRLARAPPAR